MGRSNTSKQFRWMDGTLIVEVHMDDLHGACVEREFRLLVEALKVNLKFQHAHFSAWRGGDVHSLELAAATDTTGMLCEGESRIRRTVREGEAASGVEQCSSDTSGDQQQERPGRRGERR